MTHTRECAGNKEQDMPEGAEKSVGQFASGIASARGSFGLILPYRKTMTREQTAVKWNCSPGTIDKYAN